MKTLAFISIIFLQACGFFNGEGERQEHSGSYSYGVERFAEESCCRDDSYCQDGLWCNGHEICDCWGECMAGLPPDCDDNDECTLDTCNEILDMCEHTVIAGCCYGDSDCDDANVCTVDTCVDNRCQYSPLPDGTPCEEDGKECTIDQCNGGVCTHDVNIGASCYYPDDECYNPGRCDASGLCVAGPLNPPINNECGGAIEITVSSIGSGCQIATSQCAEDNYSGSCGGAMNPDMVYYLEVNVDPDAFQLYSYNVTLDADFNSILYVRKDCSDPATEIVCNDDCIPDPILNCGEYDLDPLDSGVTIGPQPAGSSNIFYIFVDGRGGGRGDFQLEVNRVIHQNNPCRAHWDNVRVVDATEGGEFRGNIDGYINDLISSGVWLVTPCHSTETPAFDWPARAWFKLAPSVDTRYRITTDETIPSVWFDTVIEVWDNSTIKGCDGVKSYVTCDHNRGRNPRTRINNLNVPAGSVYLIGISSYSRPVSGNYVVTFEII